MKPEGEAYFPTFSGKLEGVVPWLYADILGLVTVAIGNLVDPIEYALALPFVEPDGAPASRERIAAAWHAVKRDPLAAKHGHRYAAGLSTIRLTPDGVASVVVAKLRQNEAHLVKRFPEFPEWPTDAQLATHSMAWACGPAFRFPALEEALRWRDFSAAARHCHINTDGPDKIPGTADDNWGVVPRNAANKTMYANAARVMLEKLDPDALFYPHAIGLTPEFVEPKPHPVAPTRAVEDLQRALDRAGFHPGPLDGKPGPLTTAAVVAFQAAHGLSPDGVVGPLTKSALDAAVPVAMPIMPANHVAPPQEPVPFGGGIVHPLGYAWPRYDAA